MNTNVHRVNHISKIISKMTEAVYSQYILLTRPCLSFAIAYTRLNLIIFTGLRALSSSLLKVLYALLICHILVN